MVLGKLQEKSRGDHTISAAGFEGECNILVAGETLLALNTSRILLQAFGLYGYKVWKKHIAEQLEWVYRIFMKQNLHIPINNCIWQTATYYNLCLTWWLKVAVVFISHEFSKILKICFCSLS